MRAAFQWACLALIVAALVAAGVRAFDLESAQDETRIQRHIAANRAQK